MDNQTNLLVRGIASQVRQWCEERDQLEKEPTGNLGGWCAIAAGHLWSELKRKGIEAEIRLAHCNFYAHCFVVVEDHIVDITASQFREFRDAAVVLIHEREAAIYEFYSRDVNTFRDARELRKFQKKARWPEHQICYEYEHSM